MTQQLLEVQKDFAREILKGLERTPKCLPSKYFYNAEGDALFQKIMELDEYYLTRAEHQIISEHKAEILKSFLGTDNNFRLVELGAGDGTKTRTLLEHFVQVGADFVYSPIDISENVLQQLEERMVEAIPDLQIEYIQGEYFNALSELNENHLTKEVVLFLGSTIGNFGIEPGTAFLKKLSENLSPGDLLFIGFDLMKDPRTVLSAYDDKSGVTRDFNFNLLNRINDELGADFDIDKFQHYPTYDPVSGETRSYLISREKQQVKFEALDYVLELNQWEAIHTEVSQKYSYQMIEKLAKESGFRIKQHFTDEQELFVDSLWEKI
ncbi:L-histidine N(alpha)-methyltransferase [Roseivirga sp.]|uniref:L-histidine N(alpha)-methyltransferase n=1 Tax=Roseivirga sp. TaxID=1964215 RepID=UPI003B528B8C